MSECVSACTLWFGYFLLVFVRGRLRFGFADVIERESGRTLTTRRCETKPEVPEYVWFGCRCVVRTSFLGKNGSGRAEPARLRGRGFKRDKVKVFERTEKDVPCDPRAKPEPAAEPSLRPKAGAAPGVDAWACTRTARGRCTCVRMRTGTSASSFGRWANAGGSNVPIAGSSKRRAPGVIRTGAPRRSRECRFHEKTRWGEASDAVRCARTGARGRMDPRAAHAAGHLGHPWHTDKRPRPSPR